MWANPSAELLSSHLTICIVEMGKMETRWPGWWSALHRVPVGAPALTPTWHWTCSGVEGTQGARQASGPVPAPTLESQEGFSPPLMRPASCKQNSKSQLLMYRTFRGLTGIQSAITSPRDQTCPAATGRQQAAPNRLPANLLRHLRACDVQRLNAKKISILTCIYLFV